ncbi:MAG: hypothetical protein KME18_19125 [Phormidium tanganyikae FI6-MK23]|jgi:hypothetical protein|nr:hypothetical protein [Phormidium tanganyikae FI6-MK23]
MNLKELTVEQLQELQFSIGQELSHRSRPSLSIGHKLTIVFPELSNC